MYAIRSYYDNKIVGKVAAVINWSEVNELHRKKTRFGWFDVIDDLEVTQALLDKVRITSYNVCYTKLLRQNLLHNV